MNSENCEEKIHIGKNIIYFYLLSSISNMTF